MAIAHKILVAAYDVLKEGQTYRELGGSYLDTVHLGRRRTALVRALQALGFDVQLTPKPNPMPFQEGAIT